MNVVDDLNGSKSNLTLGRARGGDDHWPRDTKRQSK